MDVPGQGCVDVVPGPAISASYRSLLEMKMIKSYLRPTESRSAECIQLATCDLISPEGDAGAC